MTSPVCARYCNRVLADLYREQDSRGVASQRTQSLRCICRCVDVGLNAEQEVARDISVFARLGWNDGKTESFAYTEVDQTVFFGASARGTRWGKAHDRAGIAFVSNGLSSDHREYLSLGGVGFILGDGRLTYGRETIMEGYYRLHAWRGIHLGSTTKHLILLRSEHA